MRLLEEVKTAKNGKFVTLTFRDDEVLKLAEEAKWKDGVRIDIGGYELDNAIATLAVRRFTERWRKRYRRAPRHFLITELGHNGTENIHLHGIIWSEHGIGELEKLWKYGWVWGPKMHKNWVNEQTVNYIVKYITKVDVDHKYYKSKVFTSQGMGAGYTKTLAAIANKYKEGETQEQYRTRNGGKMAHGS